ncbi:hypothetical protein JCM8547_007868 [Rhodosporidiobolus lusitaniae]
MLSRLKRRTPSSAHDYAPADSDDPASHDLAPSSSSSSTTSASSPMKNSSSRDHIDSGRTLSPSRALFAGSARSSRSSSTASLHPPDRRSLNLSLPASLDPPPGSNVLVANGPGVGAGGLALASADIGQGSLSLDHLAPPGMGGSGAPLTLVVQAPELMQNGNLGGGVALDRNGTDTGMTTPTAESADMRTPVPSSHPGFPAPNGIVSSSDTNRGRGFSSASNPSSSLSPAVPSSLHPSSSSSSSQTRPRSHTTSEAFLSSSSSSSRTHHQQPSGLDALAALNASPSPLSSRPHSPHRSLTYSSSPSTAGHSHPPSRSASRPGSRSSSVSQQQHQSYPDALSLRPPSATGATSPSRARGRPPASPSPSSNSFRSASGPAGGIAGALALSGVALASPNGALRQPHGLVRISSDLGRERAGSAGEKDGAPLQQVVSNPTSARESLDGGASSPTGSLSVAGEGFESSGGGGVEEDLHSNDGHGGGAFLSMDQLGDFDDVVSQLGTGYAVASSKRNADFHALFKGISDDDYLIEDYGCALQREILIQGRLYISEHHLSFYANIFGWVTSLTIPFSEVCSIEKRMTAYVIPNAIQVATMHARHTFASFLSRDTTYDLIGNIWRMVHPVVPMSAGLPDAYINSSNHDARSTAGHSHVESEDEGGGAGGTEEGGGGGAGGGTSTGVEQPQKAKRRWRRRPRGGTGESTKPAASGGSADGSSTVARDGAGDSSASAGGENGEKKGKNDSSDKPHPPTVDTCPTLKNLKEVCMDAVFPGKPEKIYNLMFTSGFMKGFWGEDQKLTEIQISDWAPQASGSNLLARSMSYIKPLNGSIGPKQTKCLITDESAHVDFNDFVCVVTTTRTPDVPSGNAFAVKTRTSMTWSRGNACRVVVTTGVEWSKSSFIKGIIERSCIDGQKTYHADLEKAMRAYIATHRNEFVEEGQDPDSASLSGSHSEDYDEDDGRGPGSPHATNAPGLPRGEGEKEEGRSAGPLAPLWDVVNPLLETLTQQSPKTLLLGLVVVLLVLSNLWTLRSGSSSSSSPSQHPLDRVARARANPASALQDGAGGTAPHDVASAVRDVLHDYFAAAGHGGAVGVKPVQEKKEDRAKVEKVRSPREEVEKLEKLLDGVEERVRRLREELRVARREEESTERVVREVKLEEE